MRSSCVIDASAAIETLTQSPESEAVEAAVEGFALFSSDLITLECAHWLRGLERGGRITDDEAAIAVANLRTLPIQRISSHDLIEHVWALRHNFTAYDASYVALARKLDCPLVTLDRGLLAARAAGVEVVVPAAR